MSVVAEAFFAMKTEQLEFSSFLEEILQANRKHAKELGQELEDHQHGQDPQLVSVVCSDSRVLQGNMFESGLGEEFTVAQAGNHVNTYTSDSEEVPHGSLDYIPHHTDSQTYIGVIGHTGCGLIGATMDTIEEVLDSDENNVSKASEILDNVEVENYTGESQGISTHVELVLSSGLGQDYDRLSKQGYNSQDIYDRLVEANVDNQVELLLGAHYDETEVFGAVYDMTGAYGEKGRVYITNYEGLNDQKQLEKAAEGLENTEVERLQN